MSALPKLGENPIPDTIPAWCKLHLLSHYCANDCDGLYMCEGFRQGTEEVYVVKSTPYTLKHGTAWAGKCSYFALKIYGNYQLAFSFSPVFPWNSVGTTLDGALCALEERLKRSAQRSRFQPQFVERVNARAGKEAARQPGKRDREFFLTPAEGKNPSELGSGALQVRYTPFSECVLERKGCDCGWWLCFGFGNACSHLGIGRIVCPSNICLSTTICAVFPGNSVQSTMSFDTLSLLLFHVMALVTGHWLLL